MSKPKSAIPRKPLLAALAMAAISLAPANHAFSPSSLAFSLPYSPSSSRVSSRSAFPPRNNGNSPSPSIEGTTLQSQSSSASEEVRIDGRTLLDNTKNNDNLTATSGEDANTTFLRRLFRKGGSAIRGDKYGASNNSTILAPADAAIKVGVEPTLEATKEEWKRAWKLHRFMMKILHRFDKCQPKDSKLALACLWWKALAGNNPTSPVYDDQLSYDLLPPVTRWIVHRKLCKLYPRLHHANVEIRTAYLDKSVSNVINSIMRENTTHNTTQASRKKIRLIVMGGGYDTRSIKLMERSLLDNENTPHHDALYQKRQSRHHRRWRQALRRTTNEAPLMNNAFDNITSYEYDLECYELDLPEVVRAKRQLLQTRLFRRRPWLRESAGANYPQLMATDFNNLTETRCALEDILQQDNGADPSNVDNIILFEGVMIYLDEGIPHSLLELCSDVLGSNGNASSGSSTGHLCFADRLENIPGGDKDAAHIEMESTGWELVDWLPKPGLARHMGVARLKM